MIIVPAAAGSWRRAAGRADDRVLIGPSCSLLPAAQMLIGRSGAQTIALPALTLPMCIGARHGGRGL